jgi:CRISPR type III-B/RAMP module-associated protein Cmr3
MAPLSKAPVTSNYPKSWLKPVYSKAPPSKAKLQAWVAADWFRQYLLLQVSSAPPEVRLFDIEHRIGIGVDPETRAAADKRIYSAEHLRLHDGVRLWAAAGLSERDRAKNGNTDLSKLVNKYLSLGGESRMCRIAKSAVELAGMIPQPPDGKLIKWVLAAPAVFRDGWLPNWIDEGDGQVRLKKGATERSATEKETEKRKAWRERVRQMPDINACLVGACIQKPVHFSGWDLALETRDKNDTIHHGGPKPTMLAVPAGSVYYFEAATTADGQALTKALHGRTQSDYFGEKGMGLGFCGVWQYVEDKIY